jgi:23S rRNA (adenine2503-C2)-methyltransferase
MKNLPKKFLSQLAEIAYISPVNVKETILSADGAEKHLIELEKEDIIESVKMRQKYGVTVCVSTQVGCNMGCAFCASGIGGKNRDLSAGEIAAQVYIAGKAGGERVGSVVYMGCGEPFDNYENVIKSVRILTDSAGADISARKITISTCGIISGIKRLSSEGLPVTLAISLHAADDDTRKKIMPIAKNVTIEEIIVAAADYAKITGRRVTFEYALISGVNDSPRDAKNLAAKLKSKNIVKNSIAFHVNLIPVNAVAEAGFLPPDRHTVAEFEKILSDAGVACTTRRKQGAFANAACGQLRAKKL